MRFIVILLFILASFDLHAEELKIGLIPEQNIFTQKERYSYLSQYIEKEVGIKINLVMLPRYGNILEQFELAHLDGAFWGSLTGAIAVIRFNVETIVRPVNLDGTTTYRGYMIVRKGSKIKDARDMKGKELVLVDPFTTAGYLFPRAYFRKSGVENIDTYFKSYYFAGSHDAAIYAVLEGKADVGFVKSTVFQIVSARDPQVAQRILILKKSPPVPSNAFGTKVSLDKKLKETLRKTFLAMHETPTGKETLAKFQALKFIPSPVTDYKPVYEMAREAGIELKSYYLNK